MALAQPLRAGAAPSDPSAVDWSRLALSLASRKSFFLAAGIIVALEGFGMVPHGRRRR